LNLVVRAAARGFGAVVTGADVTRPEVEFAAELRRIWLEHQVVSLTDQLLDDEHLEAFARSLGEFGHDPYVRPMEGHEHVLEVKREADERVAPFGSGWHSDWSFQATPPAATILHARVVPPVGGDTWYADGIAAYEELDPGLRAELDHMTAVHSARRPYSREGWLRGRGPERSMTILPSDDALDTQEHPLVRTHPETGRRALWVNPVYTLGIKQLDVRASDSLLARLFEHAIEERFLYKLSWQENMLTIWDNRSVQHCARGGYDGHRRVMHRITIAGDAPR
jgi:taurine dioxygenase